MARRGWIVWAVGVVAYILAVMQRTTFAIAGLDAAERFTITPGVLSAFVFVQVAVYLAAQVPAGLVPLLVQVTTMLCQIGQVLSALPFAWVLHGAGWSSAFGAAALASALAALLVFAVVRNAPAGVVVDRPAGTSFREILDAVREVWRRPGTRLGFFGHMGTQFSMMVFTLLWGVPWLVSAQGLTADEAGGMLTLFVVCTIAIGPLFGIFTMRHPLRRSWVVLGVIAAEVAVWTAVLAQPGPAPRWLLVLLIVALGAAGPGSVVGIDIARTHNPSANLGVAQSMVNMGGFLASLVVLVAMGGVLTAMGGFTPEAFRIAWLVQYAVWGLAVVGILVARRQARRLDAEHGVHPRPLREIFAR